MAVYDDQRRKQSTVPSDDDSRHISGISPKEEAAMEREAGRGASRDLADRKGLYNPRARAERKAKKKAEKEGGSALGGAAAAGVGGLAGGLGGSAQKLGNFFLGSTKRKAATGGGTAGVIIALLGILGFSSVQGPLQFVHLAQNLSIFHFSDQDDFSNRETARFLFYALTGRAAKGRLGIINNKIADRVELRLNNEAGLRTLYDARTGRFVGYGIIEGQEDKASRYLSDVEKDGIPTNSQVTGRDVNGKDYTMTGVNARDSKFKNRRVLINAAVRTTGLDGIASANARRLMKLRAGVNFHPWKNVVRKAADKIADFNKKERADQAAKDDNGPEGKPNPAKEERKAKREKVRKNLDKAKGPLAAIIIGCAVKQFSASIDGQKIDNQQTLMRMGFNAITRGNQVMYGGDFSLDQLGAMNAQFFDPKTGTSWTQDPGVQQEMGDEPTGKDYAVGAKPVGEKPFLFQAIDDIPDFYACDVVDFVTGAVTSIPGVEWTLEQFNSAVNAAFTAVGLPTPEQMLNNIRDYFAGAAIDTLSQGAMFGGLVNIGARLAANDSYRSMGGRELTNEEAVAIKQDAQERQRQTLASASLYDKYLNLQTSTSMLSSLVLKMPSNSTQLANYITSLPGTIGNMAISVFGGRTAHAAVEPYDYGFALVGFSEAEKNNPEFDNPFANEDYMLEGDRLDRMNRDYGQKCFNMQVGRDGNLTYGESGDLTAIPADCKDPNNTELVHYRFYIAEIINAMGMACYYEDEDSCKQLNAGGSADAAATPAAPVNNGEITIGDTSAQTCSAGTDGGIGDGYADGKLYKIRLCQVQGITVNSQIATNVDKLLNDAKAQGIEMTGSAFRTMADQQAVYNANCPGGQCSVQTAKPGTSNHQMGLAIDFSSGGQTICFPNASADCNGNKAFDWLKANAGTYGLKNLPKEAWHWSYNGN